MFKILRTWDVGVENGYSTLEAFIESLYKRPRVDYRISEYVFGFINENIMKKYNIMQKKNYQIELSFSCSNEENDLIFFDDEKGYTYGAYDDLKWDTLIIIYFSSKKFNEEIKPIEYANIVYDMISTYLIEKYKKISKRLINKNKNNINKEIVEKYTFPALFDDQKYVHDYPFDGFYYIAGEEKVNIRKEYMKKYKEGYIQ